MSETLKPNGTDGKKSLGRSTRVHEDARRREVYNLVNAGAKLLARRQAREAAHLLEKAYYLDPNNVAVKINLGGAYILLGRFRDAVPILEEAAQQAPDNAMVWTNLAAAYLGHLEQASPRQQENAIQAFKKALEVDPKAPNVSYNLGLIYLRRGDLLEALTHFRRALEVNPGDKDARHYIHHIQVQLSRPSGRETDSAGEGEEEGEGRK